MKKKALIVSIVIVFVAAIYAGILILGNVGFARASVAVVKGSYGEQYANDNNLNTANLSDSNRDYFDIRYEDFDYDIGNDGSLNLLAYKGVSNKLVVPESIDGRTVKVISDRFFDSLKGVTDLYVPSSVKSIDGNARTNIVIHCDKDDAILKKLTDAGWNVQEEHDSEYVDYSLGNNPFSFDSNESFITITGYNGDKSLMVIPSHINGVPVTTVSMDLLGAANVIVIPETVNSITGTSSKIIYSPLFAIELAFSILAFVLALITINVIIPRFKNDAKEVVLSSGQIVLTFIYVVLQCVFSIIVLKYDIVSPLVTIIISSLILVLYIILILVSGMGRKSAIKVEERVAEKTASMKDIKEMAKGLSNGVDDDELKKKIKRLEEDIRYSDPVSRTDLEDLEVQIKNKIIKLKELIKAGNNSEISNAVNELQSVLEERNLKCKSGK